MAVDLSGDRETVRVCFFPSVGRSARVPRDDFVTLFGLTWWNAPCAQLHVSESLQRDLLQLYGSEG